MATLPVLVDEERLIREQIAQVELPVGVRLKSVKPMTEWTGEPAWEITFSASTRFPLTKRRRAALVGIYRAVSDRFRALNLDKLPFVRFVEVR